MSNILSITYEDAVPVTPSDSTNDPSGPFAGFYVGIAGDVKVRTSRGRDVVFPACNAGTIYTCAILRVWSTGSAHPTSILGVIAMPFKGKPVSP